MFGYGCPNEIKSYDRRQWIYEIRQQDYIYEHIATRRTGVRLAAPLLMSVGVGFVLMKYGRHHCYHHMGTASDLRLERTKVTVSLASEKKWWGPAGLEPATNRL